MDYEGICEDLLEMEHKAEFHATQYWLSRNVDRADELLGFAAECQDFRHYLFLNGHGYGGH